MTILVDTSFLTPLFRTEPVSKQIEDFLPAQSPGTLVISHWTRVEFASVMASEVRMKTLHAEAARKLIEGFDALVDESLHVLIPATADFDLARNFVGDFATQLRGPDTFSLRLPATTASRKS